MPDSISSSWGRIGAHISWANTTDRTARTAKARAALEQKFLDDADGDPVRAAHLRKAHFALLALKSAQARRARRGGAPPGHAPDISREPRRVPGGEGSAGGGLPDAAA